jgi:hypothetical protein
MSTRALPHDPYMDAVVDALAAAGLNVTDSWTSDAETHGVYCYLNAVITLTPDDIEWPHGLLLMWAWHTGLEDGGPERGPSWEFAGLNADGSNEYPTDLPVDGYAAPEAVVEAARKVVAVEIGAGGFHNFGQPKWDGGLIGGTWEHAGELTAACEAWASDETAPAPAGLGVGGGPDKETPGA